MKLSAKFARQESEQQRLERIARKRVSGARAEAVRRMLGLDATDRKPRRTARQPGADAAAPRQLPCPECDRRFALPMHLGRHLRAIHHREPAAGKGAPEAA